MFDVDRFRDVDKEWLFVKEGDDKLVTTTDIFIIEFT